MVTAMLPVPARLALSSSGFADVRWHAEIDSTNRDLADLARQGHPEGVMSVADHQTDGRGRGGREWVAPPGSSLLMSVLLRPDIPVGQLHLATVLVAMSAADACVDVAGFSPSLKWPNDLVVDTDAKVRPGAHRKLGGILAEAVFDDGPLPPAVVVGIGINIRWPDDHPPQMGALADRAITAEEAAGKPVDRTELLVSLAAHLRRRYDSANGSGWDAVVVDYRQRCGTLGRFVRAELGEEIVTGRAVDIGPDGDLVIELTPGGQRRSLTVGEVVHLASG